MAVIVLPSFPLTYFLPLLRGSHDFQLLHHPHGLACFAWMGLLVWQTGLVAKGQVARHRGIGLVGLLLSGGLIVSGYWIAQRAGENHRVDTPLRGPGRPGRCRYRPAPSREALGRLWNRAAGSIRPVR